MSEPKITVREGDIEALRRKSSLEGRPIKSNTMIDHKGNKIHYQNGKKGVRILGINTDD